MRSVLAVVALLAACETGPAPTASEPDNSDVTVEEVSGVVVRDGFLYVVDDSVANTVFRAPLPPKLDSLIDLNSLQLERLDIGTGILVDIESVDVLTDGRVVVLSERLRALADQQGVVVEYDYPLAEIGRRGLEGLAVRRLPLSGSRVAVIWEGGYPDHESLNPEVEKMIDFRPLRPVVFVHDLAADARPGRIRWNEGRHITLEVPTPPGAEPEAQRFRAPAIEWCRLAARGPDVWGFITILSSQNATPRPEFRNHWLQRFDLDGKPVGEPLNLEDHLPAASAHANWEGLAWLEPGQRLILVHEGRGDASPNAFALELPEEWRYEQATSP